MKKTILNTLLALALLLLVIEAAAIGQSNTNIVITAMTPSTPATVINQ